jgi:hypothetical protein
MAGAALFAGSARRWVAAFALAPVLATIAACGGDSGPTPEERRAAKAKWIQRVDAACRKANSAIAKRGWPADLVDLDRLVVRGIGDAQTAIKEISAQKIPEGAGPNPGAFVKELKALDPELKRLSDASEDLEPADLVKAAEALKPRIASAEKAAEDAGLSDCLTHDERFFVPDAVRAPVFAEQLNKLDRTLLRRIEKVNFADAETPGEFATAFRRYSEIIDTAIEGIDALDPPQWAADQTGNYQVALRDLQSVTQKFTAILVQDKGKPLYALDRAKYMRTQRELNRAAKKEAKTRRKMLRAVGASPTGRLPEQGEPAEPDSAQVS